MCNLERNSCRHLVHTICDFMGLEDEYLELVKREGFNLAIKNKKCELKEVTFK